MTLACNTQKPSWTFSTFNNSYVYTNMTRIIRGKVEPFLTNKVDMPFSQEFLQGVNLGIVICLLMLSAEMRRQNQRQNSEERGQDPREHDERDSWKMVSWGNKYSRKQNFRGTPVLKKKIVSWGLERFGFRNKQTYSRNSSKEILVDGQPH